jgi:eukaryotic-like serine/threonine-protein kinase
LAILVLHLQHGKDHFSGWTPELLISTILRGGGYNALIRDKESDTFDEFFRGLLVLNSNDRWDADYLKQWLEGKRFNVLVPSMPAEAIRPFEIGGYQASTRRELAHLLYINWENIPEILHGSHLMQWISISLRNKELAESVSRVGNSIKEIGTKNPTQLAEQLMRLLLMFDPAGPIRIKPLSLHIDGIDALFSELYANKAENELQLMAKFIEFNMVNSWFEQQRKAAGDHKNSIPINITMTKLDRLRISIRNTGMGFGLERALYDLNPEMPCLSPLLSDHHIIALPMLLKRLDSLAPRLAGGQDPIDKHIAAFIASKLNIQHEIKLHELASMPALSSHRAVIALRLLAMAQQRASEAPLPGLTHWIGTRILPALETLRSRTLRKTLVSLTMDRIDSGRLPYMAELIIDSNYATADRDGYTRAIQTYRSNKNQIASLRKGDGLDEKSSQLGYSIAKLVASMAFILTLLSMVQDWGM